MAVMIVRIAVHGFLSVCCSTLGHQSSAKGGNAKGGSVNAKGGKFPQRSEQILFLAFYCCLLS